MDERNPYNLKNKVDMAGVEKLAPNFDWPVFFRAADYPRFEIVNVESPKFFKEVNDLLASEPLDNWKTICASTWPTHIPISLGPVCG